MKGMNPGAAFVFLIAGPATNSVAITVIAKELGVKATILFLGTIIVCSFVLGYLLNILWGDVLGISGAELVSHSKHFIPYSIEIICSIFIVFCIVIGYLNRYINKKTK